MATERVTIQVESNIGEDGPLTVMDTLHQFMDAFELLAAAVAQEPGGEKVKWRLERLSKNSPATATAIAYSADPDVVVAPLVFHGKRRLSSGMAGLGEGEIEPWLRDQLHLTKPLFKRNLNGVGRTVFDFDDDAPRIVVVEKTARRSLKAIEKYEALKEEEDRSRAEYGSIDAYVSEARTYHGRPAIYVKDRLSGRVVPCVLNDQLAEQVGQTHSWHDAWSGKRVRIQGQMFYDKSGHVSRVYAVNLIDVTAPPIDLRGLQKSNILRGKTPTQHIDAIWGYADE